MSTNQLPAGYANRFQKGAPSANPGGRTPQAVKLAKRLMQETQDGEEIIRLVLGIANGTGRLGAPGKNGKGKGKPWSEASRRWAIELVVDRLWGKAKQHIELDVGSSQGRRLDRSALTDEEAALYQRLVRKMSAPIEAPAGPPVLELPPSAVADAVAAAVAADPASLGGDPAKEE